MKRMFKKFISLACNLVTRLNTVFCKVWHFVLCAISIENSMQLLIRPNERIDKIKWNSHFFDAFQTNFSRNVCIQVMYNTAREKKNNDTNYCSPIFM